MATPQQISQLRAHFSDLTAVMGGHRELDIKELKATIDGRVAVSLVKPLDFGAENSLEGNQIIDESWRKTVAERVGNEAAIRLQEEVPRFIEQALSKHRFDGEYPGGEEYSASGAFYNDVKNFYTAYTDGVLTEAGFSDLADHPAFLSAKTKTTTAAQAVMLEALQQETVRQATKEATAKIERDLELAERAAQAKVAQDIESAETQGADTFGDNVYTQPLSSKILRDIRQGFVDQKYPLPPNVIEKLIYKKVYEDAMNLLNDPYTVAADWTNAVNKMKALDERGFGDNNLSLSELVLGKDKAKNQSGLTLANKQYLARMKADDIKFSTTTNKEQADYWRKFWILTPTQRSKLTLEEIINQVPYDKYQQAARMYREATATDPKHLTLLGLVSTLKYGEEYANMSIREIEDVIANSATYTHLDDKEQQDFVSSHRKEIVEFHQNRIALEKQQEKDALEAEFAIEAFQSQRQLHLALKAPEEFQKVLSMGPAEAKRYYTTLVESGEISNTQMWERVSAVIGYFETEDADERTAYLQVIGNPLYMDDEANLALEEHMARGIAVKDADGTTKNITLTKETKTAIRNYKRLHQDIKSGIDVQAEITKTAQNIEWFFHSKEEDQKAAKIGGKPSRPILDLDKLGGKDGDIYIANMVHTLDLKGTNSHWGKHLRDRRAFIVSMAKKKKEGVKATNTEKTVSTLLDDPKLHLMSNSKFYLKIKDADQTLKNMAIKTRNLQIAAKEKLSTEERVALSTTNGIASLNYSDLTAKDWENRVLQAVLDFDLNPTAEALLRAKAKNFQRIQESTLNYDKADKDLFKNLADNPVELGVHSNSHFQDLLAGFSDTTQGKHLAAELSRLRIIAVNEKKATAKLKDTQNRRKAASLEFGRLSNFKNREDLLKVNLQELKADNALMFPEGLAFLEQLVQLKNGYLKQDQEVIDVNKQKAYKDHVGFLMGADKSSKMYLLSLNLSEFGIKEKLQLADADYDRAVIRQGYLREHDTSLAELDAKEKKSLNTLTTLVLMDTDALAGVKLTDETYSKVLSDEDAFTAAGLIRNAIDFNEKRTTAQSTDQNNQWLVYYQSLGSAALSSKTRADLMGHFDSANAPQFYKAWALIRTAKKTIGLPDSQRRADLTTMNLIQNPDLATMSAEKIAGYFDIALDGNEARLRRVFDVQRAIKAAALKEENAKTEAAKTVNHDNTYVASLSALNDITLAEAFVTHPTSEEVVPKTADTDGELYEDTHEARQIALHQLLEQTREEAKNHGKHAWAIENAISGKLKALQEVDPAFAPVSNLINKLFNAIVKPSYGVEDLQYGVGYDLQTLQGARVQMSLDREEVQQSVMDLWENADTKQKQEYLKEDKVRNIILEQLKGMAVAVGAKYGTILAAKPRKEGDEEAIAPLPEHPIEHQQFEPETLGNGDVSFISATGLRVTMTRKKARLALNILVLGTRKKRK